MNAELLSFIQQNDLKSFKLLTEDFHNDKEKRTKMVDLIKNQNEKIAKQMKLYGTYFHDIANEEFSERFDDFDSDSIKNNLLSGGIAPISNDISEEFENYNILENNIKDILFLLGKIEWAVKSMVCQKNSNTSTLSMVISTLTKEEPTYKTLKKLNYNKILHELKYFRNSLAHGIFASYTIADKSKQFELEISKLLKFIILLEQHISLVQKNSILMQEKKLTEDSFICVIYIEIMLIEFKQAI